MHHGPIPKLSTLFPPLSVRERGLVIAPLHPRGYHQNLINRIRLQGQDRFPDRAEL